MMLGFALAKAAILIVGGFFGSFFGFLGVLAALTPEEIWDYGKMDGLIVRHGKWIIVPKGFTHPANFEDRHFMIFDQRFVTPVFCFFYFIFAGFFLTAAFILQEAINRL